jgi:hypothetical protein
LEWKPDCPLYQPGCHTGQPSKWYQECLEVPQGPSEGMEDNWFCCWEVQKRVSKMGPAGQTIWSGEKMRIPSCLKRNVWLHSWGSTQKNVTQVTPEAPAHPCLLRHYSQ